MAGTRFHPSVKSARLIGSVLAVLDRALTGHRKRRRPCFGGIVPGAQAQGDQRKRVDFAGALQVLPGLKALECIAAILIPDPAGRLGSQIALGHQSLLNLLIPLRRWSHLAGPPGYSPPLLASFRRGRSGSHRLGMAPLCRAGLGCSAFGGRGSGRGLMRNAGCKRPLAGGGVGRNGLGRGLGGRFCRRRRLCHSRRWFPGLRLRWRHGGIRH